MEETKTCPQCQAEYTSRAQTCADCGVPLVWSSRIEQQRLAQMPVTVAEAEWGAWTEGKILGQVAGDHKKIVEAYLGYFKAAGIRSTILPRTYYQSAELKLASSPVFGTTLLGGKGGELPIGDVVEGFEYNIFVSREDQSRAQEIIDEVFGELHPDQPEGFSVEFEVGHCPACGCDLTEDAVECPDCGLSFA